MSESVVVRFAGEAGVDTATDILAAAVAEAGYHILTFKTYPSQIKGGPVVGQVHIATREIATPGDRVDVLVTLNQYAYDHNIDQLTDDGIVIYDSEEFELDGTGRTLGMAADKLARESGNARAANMVVIGAVAQIAGLPMDSLEAFATKRYSRGRPGDAKIIEGNIKALHVGAAEAAQAAIGLGSALERPHAGTEQRVLIKGFEAAGLGAMAAGLDFFVGYPISPATTMLTFMEENLVGDEMFVAQSSSEIESIAALIGAGFAGKKAMTSTAGPGLSLMGEGLGLAWMAEIPLVVVDVQRGGPATGLPTKTEQSDLLVAMNPGHGDMRLPVIAPGTVEEAFWATVEAVNWAERYQGPVIVLSEASIAEAQVDIPAPDLRKVTVESRGVPDESQGTPRYAGPGVSPFPVPGGPGAYVANGSEHDEQGDTTHLPDLHVQMMQRRFQKLAVLETGHYEAERPEASIAVMPWGGSKAAAYTAYQRLAGAGQDLGWYYTMFLNPLPPGLVDELKRKDLVLVPELNYLGQFSSVLRSLGVNAQSITQYTGLPFKISDLETRILERIAAAQGELAAV